jgi:hypothetical protein
MLSARSVSDASDMKVTNPVLSNLDSGLEYDGRCSRHEGSRNCMKEVLSLNKKAYDAFTY